MLRPSQPPPTRGLLSTLAALLAAACLAAAPVGAVETTGVPGSPNATTTIDGKQLPPPDPKFGGVIKDDALQSTPWWAPRVVPPKKAPNILLIMTDDSGFGVPSTFADGTGSPRPMAPATSCRSPIRAAGGGACHCPHDPP